MFFFYSGPPTFWTFKKVNIIMSFGEDFYNGAGFCEMSHPIFFMTLDCTQIVLALPVH